jgi:hypothetical protein
MKKATNFCRKCGITGKGIFRRFTGERSKEFFVNYIGRWLFYFEKNAIMA